MFDAFLNDDSGAVTVDWVVLTAAIVGLGIAVITSVSGGTNELATKISSNLADGEVATLTGLETASTGGN
jgi:Flp pilus assembly pilin Flp